MCPCHHGMARLRVTDGGNGLQIWRTADNRKGVVLQLGDWRGGTNVHSKNRYIMKRYAWPRNWTDFLERPRERKMHMTFRTNSF